MQNTCATCSATLDPDAVFCPSCGTTVAASATVYCPQCSKSLRADSKFCKYCAFNLATPAQNTQPAASNQAVQPSYSLPSVTPGTANGSALAVIPIEDKRLFISLIAATLAALCFFLPWIQFAGIAGFGQTSLSGFNLANYDGSLWLFFLLPAAIIAAVLFFRSQQQIEKAIPVTITCAAVGVQFLWLKLVTYSGLATPFGNITSRMVGLSPSIGIVGMVLGLVIAAFGSAFLLSPSSASSSGIKSNRAGVICYLGFPILGILWLIAPIVFLITEPHKRNRFIRFHAFQALLVIIALLIIRIIIGLSKPERLMFDLLFCVVTSFLVSFLMYKAATNEMYKLPVIGDLAMKWTEKEENSTSVQRPKTNIHRIVLIGSLVFLVAAMYTWSIIPLAANLVAALLVYGIRFVTTSARKSKVG